MEAGYLNPHWYRVAELHPRLKPHVQVRRQVVRGQRWHVLHEPVEGRHFRLNPGAYAFVGLCDGRLSVREIWDHLVETMGEAAPSQTEAIGILTRLSEGGVLQAEAIPDVDLLFERQAERRERQRWSQLNPFFFRAALFDPRPYLGPIERVFRPLMRGPALLAWLALMGLALTLVLLNGAALAEHARSAAKSPLFLLTTWAVYPFIKLIHELGHALVIRRFGGDTRMVGVSLFLLMPVPWVDARDVSGFSSRGQRFLVSAAGIMVELALAALALLVWLAAEPGLVRDAALAVMLVAAVSTVLFNGNPLLRYDGYFMLCDAIDLPNLGPRSAQYWLYLAERHVLRQTLAAPATAPGERKWLLLYGPLSFAYRVFILVTLVYWAAGVSFTFALAAGLLLWWSMFIQPGRALLLQFLRRARAPGQRRQARRAAVAGLVLVGLLVFALPLPHRVVADAMVWLPDQARVRPGVDGFVETVLVADGARVEPGQPLIQLHDPQRLAEREQKAARLTQVQGRLYANLGRDHELTARLVEEIRALEADLADHDARIDRLIVRAEIAGRLVLPWPADLPGRHVARGEEVAYILPDGDARVRAVVDQADIGQTLARLRGVEVWLADGRRWVDARWSGEQPAATQRLPSPALGELGGGRIPLDPVAGDGVTARAPHFLIDLSLPGVALPRVGARAQARFDLGYEPLAWQLGRRLKQSFLGRVGA
ncbi:MAG: biotin/lipoyl-binding protein [Pseudomonadota bacterium]